MPTSDSMEPLLEQIANLLKLAQDNAGKKVSENLDPNIIKRLEALREIVDSFQNVTIEGLIQQGIDPAEAVKNYMKNPGKYNPQEKKVMRKAVQLGLDTLMMKGALECAQNMGRYSKDITKLAGKKTSKKSVKARQKKFKRVGGDSNWVPL